MKISDLKLGAFDKLVAQVEDIGPVKEFPRADGTIGRVMTILLKDETGQIPLTLWGEECDMEPHLKRGRLVEITYGWCKKFNEQPQIQVGKWGGIKVED